MPCENRDIKKDFKMTKKIGIISDTHGLLRQEVLDILQNCDCILHAGDFDRPEILEQLRYLGSIYAVRGNNDRGWRRIFHRLFGSGSKAWSFL